MTFVPSMADPFRCSLLSAGETGRLIAGRDWSGTPLGPLEAWPQSLRTALGLVLRSPVPMVLLWGPEGVMLYNDGYSGFAGGRHPELLGSNVREGWPEVAEFNDNVMRVGLSGGTLAYRDMELTLYRHGGPEQVFMNLDYSPVPGDDGEPAGVLAVVVETTAAILAERRLRESEALSRAQAEELRAVFDAVPAGIWITHDAQAHEITGNARSHEFLRVPQGRNQSKGAPGTPTGHFRFLDAEGREIPPRDLPVQAAARGEPLAQREYRVAFDDGTHIDIFGNATPLRDARGEPAGAVAAFMDITARKAAEAALREETRVLETLNRAGAALAGELDPARLVQNLTDAGVELTGAAFGAFFHNDMDESGERLHLYTLSGAERSAFERLGGVRATGVIAPLLRNEGVVRSDDIPRDSRYGQFAPHHGMPPGHLPVRSYLGVPVVSRSGEVLGGLLFGHPEPGRFTGRHERLMTGLAAQAAIALDNARLFQAVREANETLEARVAEALAERERAEEALRQAQKMEAIGQLTGGIAHDFNNLLTPILGGLDIVRRRISDERSEKLLGGAMQAAERAKTLVSRLLAFARRQTLQPRAVDLAELVGGLRELIDRSLGPAIEVRVEMPPGLPPVLVDPNQLELALLNLSVNARDAMPSGGRLTISAETKEASECPVPGLLAPGRYLRLIVGDTGVGMDEATLSRAVEPFFSTKGIGKGTGLGLSMVHGLAAQSGGLFKLASRVGEGTTAVLWLPAAPEGALPESPVEAAAPRAPRPAVVLLVDDEALVRLSTAEGLRDLGYEVLEVGTAAEALEVLRVGLLPDIVVTDHVMPGMTGAQLAAELRERAPGLPILMITGYANLPPEQTRGLAVLSKPFRQAELATLLAQLLGGEGRVVPLRVRARPDLDEGGRPPEPSPRPGLGGTGPSIL